MVIEKKRRSVAKALSWRVTATATTTVISFMITGSIAAALKIGAIEAIAKMALYYFHERAWTKVKYGLHQPLDYQI